MKNLINFMLFITSIFIFTFISLSGFAEEDTQSISAKSESISSDSLEKIIQSPVKDSFKLHAIINWTMANRYSAEPKLVSYLNLWIKYAEQLGKIEYKYSGNLHLGTHYYLKGEYDLALKYYYNALRYAKTIADDKFIAKCFMGIGNVQFYLNKHDEAEKTYYSAIEHYSASNDSLGIISCWIWLGLIYESRENFDMAIEFQKKSLNVARRFGYQAEIGNATNNIGEIYFKFNKVDSARKYIELSMEIDRKLKDTYNISIGHINLGDIDLKTQDHNKAIKKYMLGLELANLHKYQALSAMANEKLSNVFSLMGNYELALIHYKQYSNIKDSLFSIESHKQITEMMTKYETEKKEKEIALLNKEKKLQKVELARKDAEVKKKNIQRNAFIGGFALVLILALVVHRGYIQKRKSNKILTEKNILITKQKAELNQTLEELRSTQEQLVESEKMASLGNLVAGVAHEINTPVGIGITASSSLVEDTKHFAELYKKDKMSRKALEEYLENTFQASELILKNMNRTGELVQSFKQVSVDQMVDEKRKFNLKSYLSDIMLGIKPEFGKKTIKIDIDCDENLEINSFPGAFAQIITNLTLNSVRHGFRKKEKGNITITAKTKCHSERSEESSHLLLQYKDDGTGISKENLPKIFDPFFTTNKQIGTGLGLHIVYNLVTQKLKGNIKCESKEGKGVLFTINLPLHNVATKTCQV